MSLEKPLTRKEIEALDKLLSSPRDFEKMVDRAVRGRKLERRRESEKATRRIRKHA